MNGYLLIPCISVSDCNLESSHLTISFPLTAAAGFVEALSLDIKERIESAHGSEAAKQLHWKRFSICLHQYQRYPGQTRNPAALYPSGRWNPDKLLNPPIVQEVKGRLCFSLIIELAFSNAAVINTALEKLTDIVLSMRFAGGDIFSFGGSSFQLPLQQKEPAARHRVGFYLNAEEMIKAVGFLPPGWFIRDRSDLIQDEPEDKLQALLETVARFPDGNGGHKRKQPGWVYITCTGYRMLEEPCKRDGRRFKEYLHAYCEPVHSAAELVHKRKITGASVTAEQLECKGILWRFQYDPDAREIQLTAR